MLSKLRIVSLIVFFIFNNACLKRSKDSSKQTSDSTTSTAGLLTSQNSTLKTTISTNTNTNTNSSVSTSSSQTTSTTSTSSGAAPTSPSNCIANKSVAICGNCLYSSQCADGLYCCPFMKKCIKDGTTSCSAPIANCNPPCQESSSGYPNSCTCNPTDGTPFSKWPGPLCQATGTPSTSSTPANKDLYVQKHNEKRALENANLPTVSWDDNLYQFAVKHVQDMCNANSMYHSTSAERQAIPGYSYAGENLAMGTIGYMDAGKAVDLWYAEKSNYSFASKSCAAGQVCGHYTQVVWSSSIKIGCAECQASGNTYISCEYGPGGNYVGQNPY